MEPIQVNVDYSTADFVRALTYLRRRIWFNRYSPVLVILGVALALIFVIYRLREPTDTINIPAILLMTIVPAVSAGGIIWLLGRIIDPWLLKRSVRKQISSSPMLQETNEIKFDEDGFAASTFLGGSSYKWEAFKEANETATELYFFTSSKFAVFVPKSAFNDEEQIERVKHFAKDRLGDRARFE